MCLTLALALTLTQVQESWHRELARTRIPGLFKASTKRVITWSVPQLIKMDGVMLPDLLCFHVSHPTPPHPTPG